MPVGQLGPQRHRRWVVGLWIFLAFAFVTGLVAWYAFSHSRPSLKPGTATDDLAEMPIANPMDSQSTSLADSTAARSSGANPCLGLQLLDVESDPDGTIQGVWLRKDGAGTSRVRKGERFAQSTLTQVVADPARESVRVWFDRSIRPCELYPVQGIEIPNLAVVESARSQARARLDDQQRDDRVLNPRIHSEPGKFKASHERLMIDGGRN